MTAAWLWGMVGIAGAGALDGFGITPSSGGLWLGELSVTYESHHRVMRDDLPVVLVFERVSSGVEARLCRDPACAHPVVLPPTSWSASTYAFDGVSGGAVSLMQGNVNEDRTVRGSLSLEGDAWVGSIRWDGETPTVGTLRITPATASSLASHDFGRRRTVIEPVPPSLFVGAWLGEPLGLPAVWRVSATDGELRGALCHSEEQETCSEPIRVEVGPDGLAFTWPGGGPGELTFYYESLRGRIDGETVTLGRATGEEGVAAFFEAQRRPEPEPLPRFYEGFLCDPEGLDIRLGNPPRDGMGCGVVGTCWAPLDQRGPCEAMGESCKLVPPLMYWAWNGPRQGIRVTDAMHAHRAAQIARRSVPACDCSCSDTYLQALEAREEQLRMDRLLGPVP